MFTEQTVQIAKMVKSLNLGQSQVMTKLGKVLGFLTLETETPDLRSSFKEDTLTEGL